MSGAAGRIISSIASHSKEVLFPPTPKLKEAAVPVWSLNWGNNLLTSEMSHQVISIKYEETYATIGTLKIVFADNIGDLQKNFYPSPGQSLLVSMGYAGSLIPLGGFYLDNEILTGPPDQILITGSQIATNTAIWTTRTDQYENMSLGSIVNQIAARNFWATVVDNSYPGTNIPWRLFRQRQESDLKFLKRIALDHGFWVQLKPSSAGQMQLIFWPQSKLELAPPTGPVITRATQNMEYSLKVQTSQERIYSSVTVIYSDPHTKQTYSASAVDPNVARFAGSSIVVRQRVENNAQALLKAQEILHWHNMNMTQGELELVGTAVYRAGNVIQLSGFGIFDRNYLIQRVAHSYDAQSGWRTHLELTVALGTYVSGQGFSLARTVQGIIGG